MKTTLRAWKEATTRKKAFMLLMALVWSRTILLRYVKAVLLRIPILGDYADICLVCVFVLTFFIAARQLRLRPVDIIILSGAAAVYLLQWLFYQDARPYFSMYAADFLIETLPLYFIGVNMASQPEEDKDSLYKILYFLSVLTLLSSIAYQMFFGDSMTSVESRYQGDMDLAYKLLPHCCYIAWIAVRKPNVLRICLCVTGAVYLLMLGTRGAALIYLFFIAVSVIIGKGFRSGIVKATVIGGVVGGFLGSPLYVKAVTWMGQRAARLGLSVRIFERLLQGELISSAGREEIRQQVLEAIGQNSIIGYGLYSDRVLLHGRYAHNIVLELWMDFGVIVGSLLFIELAVTLAAGYLRTKHSEEKGLLLALIFSSMLKLLLSGSYLNESTLFLALGMSVGIFYGAKKQGSAEKQPASAPQDAEQQQEKAE